MMTRSEIAMRIKAIREELENRHKTGTVKMAAANGASITTEELQNEMFRLTYKMSKMD